MTQTRFLFGDEADAAAFWADKEWKKFAVDVTAGPTKKPTYRQTHYARARDGESAIECVKRNLIVKPPRGARFVARLAGPRELGCVPTPKPG
ncbi:TPA: hypothetical protein ACK3Q6_004476 [Burkholderia cepacia]